MDIKEKVKTMSKGTKIIVSSIICIAMFGFGYGVGGQVEYTNVQKLVSNAKTTLNTAINAEGGNSSSTTPSTNTTPTPATTAPSSTATWQTVQTFTGSADTKTAPFTIDSGASQWRITWSTTAPADDQSNFIVNLDDSTGNQVDSIANSIGSANSVTYESTVGNFSLDVQTSQQYTITVEELK